MHRRHLLFIGNGASNTDTITYTDYFITYISIYSSLLLYIQLNSSTHTCYLTNFIACNSYQFHFTCLLSVRAKFALCSLSNSTRQIFRRYRLRLLKRSSSHIRIDIKPYRPMKFIFKLAHIIDQLLINTYC
jgi:hypothetical protein